MKLLLASLALVGVMAGVSYPDDTKPVKTAPDKKTGSELMQRKLEHAKKLLEGLTTNNFDMIEKNASELMLISQKAEFLAVKTKEYELQTNTFRRALETIGKKAKDKNLDGATLGYMDMTMACVRCHESNRETKVGLLPVNSLRDTTVAGR